MGRIYPHIDPAIVGIGILGGVPVPFEAGEIQPVLVDAQPFFIGQKLPGKGDGFLFKIVPQRPVPQHFKEGAVGGVPHFVDVPGTDAFLHICQPHPRRMLGAHQIGHQRMHTRRGKQHRGIVFRDQGCGRNDGMALFPEKVQIQLAQFIGFEQFHNFIFLSIFSIHKALAPGPTAAAVPCRAWISTLTL